MFESLSPPARALLFAARRFSRLQMPRSPLFAELRLRPGEFFLLFSLFRAETGVKPSDLAQQLGVTPGHVTQLISSLEPRGLLRREPDAEDRRAVRVVLTDAGRCIMATAFEYFQRAYAGLLEELGEEACGTLTGLLDRASAYLEGLGGYPPPERCPQHHPAGFPVSGTDSAPSL